MIALKMGAASHFYYEVNPVFFWEKEPIMNYPTAPQAGSLPRSDKQQGIRCHAGHDKPARQVVGRGHPGKGYHIRDFWISRHFQRGMTIRPKERGIKPKLIKNK